VPWQLIAQETGATIRVAPVDEHGQLIVEEYIRLFNDKTRFVSATHVSNALGTVTPVQELVQIAHRFGVRIAIDGAQSISHIPTNVTALDADFFVFRIKFLDLPGSASSMASRRYEEARPYQGGGNMIADVTFELTRYQLRRISLRRERQYCRCRRAGGGHRLCDLTGDRKYCAV
jgi:cysteine desulfurase/selenocysteine lyase